MIGFDEGKETGVTSLSNLRFSGMTKIIYHMFEMFGLYDVLVFFGDDVENDFGEEEGG